MEESNPKPTLAQLKEEPHYSYSALNTYINTCQLLYYYRYIEKAEAERTPVALPFGSAFHSVLSEQAQAAKTGKLLTADEMTEAFATYFQANCKDAYIVFKRDENIEDQIATAKRMFEVVNKEWLDYWNIQSVAEPFRIEIPGLSKPVIGELDMVISEQTPFDDENDKGSDTIVDFKTAARMWSDDKPAKDLQATVFSYAFEKTHGRRPSFRFDVVTKAKTPTVKHLYTSRDEDSYQRLEKLFLMADKGIQAGVFMPNEGSFACSDCPFADHCSGWHCNSVHTAIPKAA